MKKTDKRAKFKRIEDALRDRIRKADANDTLPSKRLLAEEFGTTPMTVRRALEELAVDGLILHLILMFGPGNGSEADEDWDGAVHKGLEAFCELFAGGLQAHGQANRRFVKIFGSRGGLLSHAVA